MPLGEKKSEKFFGLFTDSAGGGRVCSKKPLTADELNLQLFAAGRFASLPDPALDIDDDDPDDAPVPIKGEPLSETILRDRR